MRVALALVCALVSACDGSSAGGGRGNDADTCSCDCPNALLTGTMPAEGVAPAGRCPLYLRRCVLPDGRVLARHSHSSAYTTRTTWFDVSSRKAVATRHQSDAIDSECKGIYHAGIDVSNCEPIWIDVPECEERCEDEYAPTWAFDDTQPVAACAAGPHGAWVQAELSDATVLTTWSERATLDDPALYWLATDVDLDGDGILDLITAPEPAPLEPPMRRLWRTLPDGTLEDAGTFGVADATRTFVDLDGDGITDALHHEPGLPIRWTRGPLIGAGDPTALLDLIATPFVLPPLQPDGGPVIAISHEDDGSFVWRLFSATTLLQAPAETPDPFATIVIHPGAVGRKLQGIGDVDRDGHPDLALVPFPGKPSEWDPVVVPEHSSVLYGPFDGVREVGPDDEVLANRPPITVPDLDGDGLDELLYAGALWWSPEAFPPLTRRDATVPSPRVADVNGDGVPDLITVEQGMLVRSCLVSPWLHEPPFRYTGARTLVRYGPLDREAGLGPPDLQLQLDPFLTEGFDDTYPILMDATERHLAAFQHDGLRLRVLSSTSQQALLHTLCPR